MDPADLPPGATLNPVACAGATRRRPTDQDNGGSIAGGPVEVGPAQIGGEPLDGVTRRAVRGMALPWRRRNDSRVGWCVFPTARLSGFSLVSGHRSDWSDA